MCACTIGGLGWSRVTCDLPRVCGSLLFADSCNSQLRTRGILAPASLRVLSLFIVSTGIPPYAYFPAHTGVATPSEFAIDKFSRVNDIVSSLLLQYGQCLAARVAGSFTGSQLTLPAKTALWAYAHHFTVCTDSLRV
jgi:hypothetical protein